MGEAARRKARGAYPAKTPDAPTEARWRTRHSMNAVLALLRSMRNQPDDESNARKPLTPKQRRLRRTRRALAKLGRKNARKGLRKRKR